jgi:hypothetical protein
MTSPIHRAKSKSKSKSKSESESERQLRVTTLSRLAVPCTACWLVALVGPTGGCGAEPMTAMPNAPTPPPSVRAALSAPAPNCTTGPTASQQACTQAMSQESPPPPPPPPHTDCTIQVMMEQVTVDQGQGISEGKLEVSVSADAGNGPVRWPSSGDMKMKVAYPKTTDVLVAEHQVPRNSSKTINVCATFTEYDGFLNGATDTGNDCESVLLTCPMGAMTTTVSAPLCRGGNCKHLNGAMTARFRISMSDEDGDGVPNDQDFTPEPSDEACRGQLGNALFIYVEYAPSNLTSIIGMIETALDSIVKTPPYDYLVIAASPEVYDGWNNTPFSISFGTIARANMVVPTTIAGLRSGYRAATSRGYAITHMVLADGGTIQGDAYFTSSEPSGIITASSVAGLLSPAATGTCAVPLLAVYSNASYMSRADSVWLNAGAKAASGPLFVDPRPQFVVGFATAWNTGQKFADALGAGFDANIVNANNDHISQYANTTLGCDPNAGAGVLDKNQCSVDFFTTLGGPPELDFNADGRTDFDTTISGAENLDIGARDIPAGDVRVTLLSKQTW